MIYKVVNIETKQEYCLLAELSDDDTYVSSLLLVEDRMPYNRFSLITKQDLLYSRTTDRSQRLYVLYNSADTGAWPEIINALKKVQREDLHQLEAEFLGAE